MYLSQNTKKKSFEKTEQEQIVPTSIVYRSKYDFWERGWLCIMGMVSWSEF